MGGRIELLIFLDEKINSNFFKLERFINFYF